MTAKLREHIRGSFVVLTHLRTAVGMSKREASALFRQALRKIIYTPYERDYPKIIPNTYASIGMTIGGKVQFSN